MNMGRGDIQMQSVHSSARGAYVRRPANEEQIPVKRPATGDWLLQVDQQRRYAALPASNAQRVIIRVTETFKEP